jgi:hypothetical protein
MRSIKELSSFQNRFFLRVDSDTGVAKIINRKAFNEFVSQFKGSTLVMELSVFDSDKRSLAQNAYYYGVVVAEQIKAHKERHGLQLSKQQMHEFNKANFFCVTIFNGATGETINIPTSTTLYNTKEFGERLEAIRQYYELNMDWIIPEPSSDCL